MSYQIIHEANQIALQRVIRIYQPQDGGRNVWTLDGVCISARKVARHGLPPDATCWRYRFEEPEQGWSCDFRAAWRGGRLMAPLATHAVIERYWADDEALVPDEDAACARVNDWVCSL